MEAIKQNWEPDYEDGFKIDMSNVKTLIYQT